MTSVDDLRMREWRLQAPVSDEDIGRLEIGDVVFLDGCVFTGREGLYHRLFELEEQPPADIRDISNVTFHCSPAVNETDPGMYHISAVSATASFRFDGYIPRLFDQYGVRVVIGKGGMQEDIYRQVFRKYQAVYLTTVGYGLG
ncbi:MAG: fumarate hydratase C-terminal domain-containing protein, partial [Fidelibacterota bacterium]